ncbi:MAG: hypothetical protein IJY82_07515 [Oscillospiraceae bacterium]|nr:hypothetical protein [Oscillospiraceae bacterium]
MSFVKKLAAGVLAIMLTLGCTSCADTTYVLQSGEETISAGIYLTYLINAYYDAYSSLSGSIKTSVDEILELKLENTPVPQWIQNKALESAKRHLVIRSKFEEMDLSLTEEQIAEINTSFNSSWNTFGELLYYENGAGKNSVKETQRVSYMNEAVFNGIYGKDGTKAVAEEDLKNFFYEKFARIKMIEISQKDSSGNALKEEEVKKLKDMADDYAARANAGTDMDELIKEYAEYQKQSTSSSTSSSASSATSSTASDATSSADVSSAATSTETSSSTTSSGSAEVETDPNEQIYYKDFEATTEDQEKLIEEVFKAENNKAVVVEIGSTYCVIYKYDIKAKAETFENNRTSVLQTMKGDEYDATVKAWVEETTFTVNEAAFNRYQPSNVHIEDYLTVMSQYYNYLYGTSATK